METDTGHLRNTERLGVLVTFPPHLHRGRELPKREGVLSGASLQVCKLEGMFPTGNSEGHRLPLTLSLPTPRTQVSLLVLPASLLILSGNGRPLSWM